MKDIPIKRAENLAKEYGYDQVIIYARKVGSESETGGEHMTTYGIDKANCDAAAKIGRRLQTELMGWRLPFQ
jgi:hypothetical protein